MRQLLSVCVLLLAGLSACDSRFTAHANRVVVVQPLADFSAQQTTQLIKSLRPVHWQLVINKPIALPANAYYALRNRYKADSLLAYLQKGGNADTVVLGLTNKDISTTKGTHSDWGIMGLGFTPGPACVVSSYRLRSNNRSQQLYKLVLHELGHTQGLPHCPVRSCYMRDAEGGNHLQEESQVLQSMQNLAFLQRLEIISH